MIIKSMIKNMATTYHKVFVYGTLKKGEPNHGWFAKNTNSYYKFLCNAVTTTKYPLIIGTKYNIPFLLYSPGVGNYVEGEVYEVNDAVFADLDILEEYPEWYTREIHQVQTIDDSTANAAKEPAQHNAWIYFIKNFKPELLNKQMLRSYTNCGTHGLKYCESELIEEDVNQTIYDIKLKE